MHRPGRDDRCIASDPLVGARLLAAGANVVMQLALPPVGYGVVESRVASGQLFARPLKRTRTTLGYLAVAMAGSIEEKRHYRQALDTVHAQVRSGPTSPVEYDAFDPELQLWVAACLYVGLEQTSQALFGPLDARAIDELYAGAAPLATTLQVPSARWPADRAAFERYWDETLARLRIDDVVGSHLRGVVMLAFLPAPLAAVLAPSHRFFTTGFLPPPFREAMRLGWTDRQQRRFDRLTAAIGWAVRWLPRPLRAFPLNVVLRDVRRRIRTGRPLV